jgi:hypothetical protein
MRCIFLIVVLLFIAGCAKPIADVKSDDYLDKSVTVKGTVEAPVKIGKLSGYTLVDKEGDKIPVASERLPAEGDEVTVKGTVKKGVLGIGYYIDVQD